MGNMEPGNVFTASLFVTYSVLDDTFLVFVVFSHKLACFTQVKSLAHSCNVIHFYFTEVHQKKSKVPFRYAGQSSTDWGYEIILLQATDHAVHHHFTQSIHNSLMRSFSRRAARPSTRQSSGRAARRRGCGCKWATGARRRAGLLRRRRDRPRARSRCCRL